MTKPEWDPENPDKLDAEHPPYYPGTVNRKGILIFITIAAAIAAAGLAFKAVLGQ